MHTTLTNTRAKFHTEILSRLWDIAVSLGYLFSRTLYTAVSHLKSMTLSTSTACDYDNFLHSPHDKGELASESWVDANMAGKWSAASVTCINTCISTSNYSHMIVVARHCTMSYVFSKTGHFFM